jgi:hypothetical protein
MFLNVFLLVDPTTLGPVIRNTRVMAGPLGGGLYGTIVTYLQFKIWGKLFFTIIEAIIMN